MENQPKDNRESITNNAADEHTASKPIGHRPHAGENLNVGKEDTTDKNDADIDDTDKYLAMEQPGVSYTHDSNSTINSDHANIGSEDHEKWDAEGGNSKYSDAFNQDDYILDDNVDLDEDQNQSISSDDEDFEETNERY